MDDLHHDYRFKALLAAMRDPRLKPADVAVYGVLLDHEQGGSSCPSRTVIAREGGLHLGSIRRSTSKLEEVGYIAVDVTPGRMSNVYSLHFLTGSAPATGSPHATGISQATGSGCARVGNRPKGSAQATATVRKGSAQATATYRNPITSEFEAVAASIEADGVALGTEGKFPEFWRIYPRKESRKKALESWRRQRLDRLAERIVSDVEARITDPNTWTDPKFIPHPTTYLNGRRWEDQWKTERPLRAGSIPLETRNHDELAAANAAEARRMGLG